MKLPSYYKDDGEHIYGFKTSRVLLLKGIESLEYNDLINEIERGEKFYAYKFMIVLFGIYRGLSSIYFGSNNKKGKKARIQCTLVTGFFGFLALLLGLTLTYGGLINISNETRWLLIPGVLLVLFTIPFTKDVITNIKGGIDMTDHVLSYILNFIEKNEVQPSVAESGSVGQETTHNNACP